MSSSSDLYSEEEEEEEEVDWHTEFKHDVKCQSKKNFYDLKRDPKEEIMIIPLTEILLDTPKGTIKRSLDGRFAVSTGFEDLDMELGLHDHIILNPDDQIVLYPRFESLSYHLSKDELAIRINNRKIGKLNINEFTFGIIKDVKTKIRELGNIWTEYECEIDRVHFRFHKLIYGTIMITIIFLDLNNMIFSISFGTDEIFGITKQYLIDTILETYRKISVFTVFNGKTYNFIIKTKPNTTYDYYLRIKVDDSFRTFRTHYLSDLETGITRFIFNKKLPTNLTEINDIFPVTKNARIK